MIVLLLLVVTAVLASAVYAGFETGVYSLNEIRLAHRSADGSLIARGLENMKKNPETFIITILFANNIVHSIASSSLTMLFEEIPGFNASLTATVVLTPVMFLFGEIVPKRLFQRYPHRLCYNPIPVGLYYIARAVFAIPVRLVNVVSAAFSRSSGSGMERYRISVNRRRLFEMFGGGRSRLAPLLEDMAVRLMENARVPVGEMMVPFDECSLAGSDMSLEEFIKLSARTGRSRFPVFDNDPRRPVGVSDLYEVLRRLRTGAAGSTPVAETLKPLLLVRDNAGSYSVMRAMQLRREVLAGVVSKDGRLLGLLPLSRLASRVALPLGDDASRIISPKARTETGLRSPVR